MAVPSSTRDPFKIGSLINEKYRLLEQIGAGGMGKVYKAAQLPLERPVALKLVHPHLGQGSGSGSRSEGENFQKRFFREASAQAQIRHRNVVTIYDYGRIDGQDAFFMVMEYLQGAPLSAQLRGGLRMAPEAVIDMLRQVTRGLREVHRQGLVHRDLKPANIFLAQEGEEGVYKLIDFGLVKHMHQAGNPDELTEAGALLGSPTYMAPEQVDGSTIDPRTDLYSLGAVAFHCLAGRPPFDGALTQVMLQHVHKPAPRLAEACPEGSFPPELERLIARCLAKAPEHRYQSADELLEDLRACEARYGLGGPNRMLSGAYPVAPPPSSSGGFPGSSPSSASLKLVPRPGEESLVTMANAGAITRTEPPPAPPKRPVGLLVGGGVVLVAMVLGALALRPAPQGPASTAPSAAPSAAPAASSWAVLTLDSIPSGARVQVGEQLVGVTPLSLPLDGSPRPISLILDGYEVFHLDSVPGESTRMVIPLKAADRNAAGKPKNKQPPKNPGSRATATATTTTDAPPALPSIRMTR
jgi:serine/threonine-protein kinase